MSGIFLCPKERMKAMAIKEISINELRKKINEEGMVFEGCGGDIQEWIDGINEQLDELFLDDRRFNDVYKFDNNGSTCLMFPLNNEVALDPGKLAMWRLQTYNAFHCQWFSDYVDNRLGGFIKEEAPQKEKPDCKLIGEDGNIFNLMGIASRTLNRNGTRDEATEMRQKIMSSGSYEEALNIIGEYVNITGGDEFDDDCDEDYDDDYEQSM